MWIFCMRSPLTKIQSRWLRRSSTLQNIHIHDITYRRYKYPIFSNEKGERKNDKSWALVITTHFTTTIIPSIYSELSVLCDFFALGFSRKSSMSFVFVIFACSLCLWEKNILQDFFSTTNWCLHWELLRNHLSVRSPSIQTLPKKPPQKASPAATAPAKKATSQTAVPSVASKGKKIIHGGTNNAELHPPNTYVILRQVEEERSSLATPPEGAANEPEYNCVPEGNSSNWSPACNSWMNAERLEAYCWM